DSHVRLQSNVILGMTSKPAWTRTGNGYSPIKMGEHIEACRLCANFKQTVWKHGRMEDGRQVGAPLAISRQISALTSHWAAATALLARCAAFMSFASRHARTR